MNGEAEGDLSLLDSSTLSFPNSLPKMTPCDRCGKLFFPWSLKTHQKRCGTTTSKQSNEEDRNIDQTISVPSVRNERFESLSDGGSESGIDTKRHPSFPKKIPLKNETKASSNPFDDLEHLVLPSVVSHDKGDQTVDRPTPSIGGRPQFNGYPGRSNLSASFRNPSPSFNFRNPLPPSSRESSHVRQRGGRLGGMSPGRRTPITSRAPATPPTPLISSRLFQSSTPTLSEQARVERERTIQSRRDREEHLVLERARLQKEIDRINEELRGIRASKSKSEQTIASSPFTVKVQVPPQRSSMWHDHAEFENEFEVAQIQQIPRETTHTQPMPREVANTQQIPREVSNIHQMPRQVATFQQVPRAEPRSRSALGSRQSRDSRIKDSRRTSFDPKSIDPSNATSPDNPLLSNWRQSAPRPAPSKIQNYSAFKFTI